MHIRLRFLRAAILLGLILFYGIHISFAATQGTGAGTLIQAVSSNLEITYEDENSNLQPTVNATEDLTTTVSAIFGVEKVGSGLSEQTVLAGGVANYEVYFQSVANTSDTLNISFDPTTTISYTTGSGSSWEVSDLSVTQSYVAEFDIVTVNFTVTASVDALNGSQGTVTVNVSTNATPVGEYTGFNNNTYGGPPTDNWVTITTVSGPDLEILSKSISQVIAPTANGYGGNETDVVPGAKLVYEIVLRNNGTTAKYVTLEQLIPTDTDYLQGSMTFNGSGSLGTTTANVDTGSGYQADIGSTTNASVTGVQFEFDEMSASPNSYVTLNFTVVVE